MIGDLYIKLGSGQAERHHVGNKGALLDKAVRAGLPVPDGIILMDTTWDQALLLGYVEVGQNQLEVVDAEAFIAFLNLPAFKGKVAVRSAFSAEDSDDYSFAGYFETVLNVDPGDPDALSNALMKVWNSSIRHAHLLPDRLALRRDILIMEMVGATRAGVAFTEREHEDDLVNYTNGIADRLVAGEIEGESLRLPKLRGWEKRLPGQRLADWQWRLQKLLRDVRRWIGNADWDVEWVDNGTRCMLVQLRPITAPTRRNEAFTIANHKEILPELPSVYMTSVIESCAPELFAYYRRFDPTLPKTRPFIEVFAGRPYINLSLMTEMMRIFGLPTRLVTDNIGGEAGYAVGLNLRRVVAKSLTLTLPRMALAQVLSVQSARRATRALDQRALAPGESWGELSDTLRWMYSRLVTEMFSLTAAIGPVLSILRALGADVIEEHNARLTTISAQMYRDLIPLGELIADRPALRQALRDAPGQVPDDPDFQRAWAAYLEVYGHRGVYESDIARPRYAESPQALLTLLASGQFRAGEPPPRTLKGILTLPLWFQASRTIRAREQWRHDAMRGFDVVRRKLLAKAQVAVEQGVLPEVEALWLLRLDEVRQLDTGWCPPQSFWQARRQEVEALAGYHLPDLLHRWDDLEQFRELPPDSVRHNRYAGISLTRGEAHGKAWVLREPSARLPEGFKPEETILIARSVDAGWVATFAQVAGVAVETGGDLSHGSIILREIGLPAITNARGITRAIRTGDAVRLIASQGTLEHLAMATNDHADTSAERT